MSETETFLNLRFGVPNGYGPGAIIRVDNYSEPWPPACQWLELAGAVRCPKPAFPPDGHVDFAAAERDRLLIEAAMAPQPAPEPYDRAAIRAMTGWTDDDLNLAMDAKIFPRAVPRFVSEHGAVRDVIELWPKHIADPALRLIEQLRLSPMASSAKR